MIRFARIGLAVSLTLGMVLAQSAVLAHSKNQTTTPVDGAVLEATPEVIGLTFSRPMRITFIRLTDTDGVDHILTRTDDMALVVEFFATPDDLPPGNYVIQWRGLSEDGHPTQGGFSFAIAE